ncbi:MAG: hypothetical protein U9Q94_00860 [Candidatus Bipolaricaulota bacterium]|nr:hypothetical protein [Candidatus Bipolaricaulota bacterium]
MKTRYLLMLVVVGLLLSGCGFVFNQPLVGPDGTIALFIGDDGAYMMLPEGDCHLALMRDGEVVHRNSVSSNGDSGVLDWSADGSKILFIETEQDEFGQPIAWNVLISGVQSDSQPVRLFRSEDIILAPQFTSEGNITYLDLEDDKDLPKLMLYDPSQEEYAVLKDDVISYRRLGWDGMFITISQTAEGSLKLAHISSYDATTGTTEEIGSFFLSQGMEDVLFILPAAFVWDVAPSGDYIALSLYEQVLITPQMEDNNEEPPLYIIDRGEDSAYRVSDRGLVPAFSMDGSLLSYIGATGENNDIPVVILYDLETHEEQVLDGTIGAATQFWIDNKTLGFAIELGNDSYKLMKVTLPTGEVTQLLPKT